MKNKYVVAIAGLITVLMITNGFGNITIVEGSEPPQTVKNGILYNESEINFDELIFDGDYNQTGFLDYIKDPYYEDGTEKYSISTNTLWLAQSWEAAKNRVAKVGAFLSRTANTNFDVVEFRIRKILTEPWLWGFTILNYISLQGDWKYWSNESNPGTLVPGDTYYVIINLFNGNHPAGEHLDWWYGSDNPYSDGKCWYSNNGGETWTYDNDRDFNFQIWGFNELPGCPSNFDAYDPTTNSIELSWTKGEGSDKTMIRRSTSGYPSSPTSGDEAYFGTGDSTSDTGLSQETTYYYSAWGYDSTINTYSTDYASDSETTFFTDLIVKDIWIDPEDFEPGDIVNLYYKIKNQGNADAVETFEIETYFDLVLYGYGEIEGLQAGQTETQRFEDFEWPDNLAVHSITVDVDTENVVDEGSHEDNNERTENFVAKLSDLKVQNVWIEPDSFGVGQYVEVWFKVENIGDKAVDDPFDIRFYFDDPYSWTTKTYDGLEKEGIIEDFFLKAWPEDYNEYEVKIWVDFEDRIKELNNDNNWMKEDFNAENQPPEIDDLDGPTVIKDLDKTYDYRAIASDWEDDKVQYQFEFDGVFSGWYPVPPIPPDQYVIQGHQWSKGDEGVVRVRAKDINGNKGPWSDPLYVECEEQGCIEGTQITMAHGLPQTKNIELIEIGDIILSYNPLNQTLTLAEVINVYEYTEELPEHYLIFNNNLQVTSNCLLYINEEWMRAEMVQIGDLLLENIASSEGLNSSEITSIEEVECIPSISFYDLEIIPLEGEACGYWADNILAGG